MSPLHRHARAHAYTEARARAAAAVRACTLEHKLIPSPSFLASGRREGGRRPLGSHTASDRITQSSCCGCCTLHCFTFFFFSFSEQKEEEKKKHKGLADQILKINHRIRNRGSHASLVAAHFLIHSGTRSSIKR